MKLRKVHLLLNHGLFLILSTGSCISYPISDLDRAVEPTYEADANSAVTAQAVSDPNFDSGPLSPVAYYSPSFRSGLLSPAGKLETCLVQTNDSMIGSAPCASGSASALAIAFERLSIFGLCLTTTRASFNLPELPVTLTRCDGNNPNQRWGYKGGSFFWGQNPNRCLDTNDLTNPNGRLVARMCAPSASQIFVMHSAESDAQPALPMGPDSLFMPLGNGFLGSDAGATVSLDFNRTLFMFNDTYINQQGGNSRSNINGFLHNTMGIMQCDDMARTLNCRIKYYFGAKMPAATAIFDDPNPSYFFWPGTGGIYDGSLLMLNGRTVSTGSGLGFANVGAMLARITNPQDTPDLWDKTQMDISHDPNFSVFTHLAAAEPHGTWTASPSDANYAYFYFGTPTGRPLMRLPFASLATPSAYLLEGASAWQYLNSRNQWTTWPLQDGQPTDFAKAQPEGALGNIVYDENKKFYYYVGQSSNLYLSPGVFFATAPSASGPWSPLTLIFTYPEHDSKSPAYIPNATCYASFAHPEMALKGQLTFTYQCATSDPSNESSYRQKLVRMQMPGASVN